MYMTFNFSPIRHLLMALAYESLSTINKIQHLILRQFARTIGIE